MFMRMSTQVRAKRLPRSWGAGAFILNIFAKDCSCEMSMPPVHFDCMGSHSVLAVGLSRSWGALWRVTFPVNCLVRCPCACRLRRPTQNCCPGLVYCLFIVNSRINGLCWVFHPHFDPAGSHKTAVPGCPGLGPCVSLHRSLSEELE